MVHPRKSTRLEASLASSQEPVRRRMMVMRRPRSSARYRRQGHGQWRPHCEGFCGKFMVLIAVRSRVDLHGLMVDLGGSWWFDSWIWAKFTFINGSVWN